MRKVKMNNSPNFALVDNQDYEKVSQHGWYENSKGYAVHNAYLGGGRSNPIRKKLSLHKLVLDTPKFVDHINQNPLDNRRKNLREADHSQNKVNGKVYRNSSTGIRGVGICGKKWKSYITWRGKQLHLGYFFSAKEALDARNKAVRKYHGEYGVCQTLL